MDLQQDRLNGDGDGDGDVDDGDVHIQESQF
jgi:hypothetical protein